MITSVIMIALGVTEKIMIVVSGKLVFTALVWGQLGMVVVMADCTSVIMVPFVLILVPPLVLLVECVGKGTGPLLCPPVVTILEAEVRRGIQDMVSSSV